MGAGIGKMFGIDKIFGGLLDSIGLGALKPLVNTAFDFATGNLPGILQDLTSLISQFGNGDFTNNVARNQPLPDAFSSNTCTGTEENRSESCTRSDESDELPANRLGQLFRLLGDIFSSNDASEIKNKLSDLFKLLSENANNRDSIQNARTNVQFFSGGVTINA
jgi:hypothetical protein